MAAGTWTSSSNGGISMAASRPKTITPTRSSLLAVFADRLVDVVDHRLAARAGNAQRLIEEIDHREPVARPHPLHLGDGQDQKHSTTRAAPIAAARRHGPSTAKRRKLHHQSTGTSARSTRYQGDWKAMW